jgi:hypothetical protein
VSEAKDLVAPISLYDLGFIEWYINNVPAEVTWIRNVQPAKLAKFFQPTAQAVGMQ